MTEILLWLVIIVVGLTIIGTVASVLAKLIVLAAIVAVAYVLLGIRKTNREESDDSWTTR